MTGLAIYLATLAVSFGLGAPLAMWLLGHRRTPLLAAPTLGYSVLAVAATLLYRAGLPTVLISGLAAALAAAGIAWTGWRLQPALLESLRANRWLIFSVLAAVAWVWLPLFTGDAQFAVFQGNQWDHYYYATAGVLFSQMDAGQIFAATVADMQRNPLLAIGSRLIDVRPSMMILYAVFGRMVPGHEMYMSGHAFASAFVVAEFMAALYLLLNLCSAAPRRHVILAVAAAGALAFGFWGQYILDLDSWSQQASVAPFLIAFACIAIPLQTGQAGDGRAGLLSPRRNETLALAFLLSGALYLYPEGAAYFAAMAAVFLCFLRFVERRPAARGAMIPVALAAAASLFAGLLAFDGIYSLLYDQVTATASRPVDWWKFFQAFLFGRDDDLRNVIMRALPAQFSGGETLRGLLHVLSELPLNATAAVLASAISGTFGLYFLSPADTSDSVAVLAFLVFFAAFFCAMSTGLWRQRASATVRDLTLFAGIGILGALALAGTGRFWGAGKALSFAAPYLCLVLGASILLTAQARWKPWFLTAAIGIWIALQLGFAVTRPFGAAAASGIHHASPYPAVQNPSYKSTYRWDIAVPLEQSAACKLVRLDIPFEWLRLHVSLALFERGKAFWYPYPVNAYLGAGRDVGKMTMPEQKADCSMAVIDHRVQLMRLVAETE